jgi:hypothetical protein
LKSIGLSHSQMYYWIEKRNVKTQYFNCVNPDIPINYFLQKWISLRII